MAKVAKWVMAGVLTALALVLASSSTAFAAGAGDEKGEAPKLTVLPFAALSGEVPARAGQKAAGMLSTEFKNAEGVKLVDAKKQAVTDASSESLAAARKAVEEAKAFRQKKKFRLADESLAKALEAYKKAAAGITDIGEVVDAYALASAVEFNTGKDDEGQKSLSTALGMAPTRELPLAATSPLFARVVADTRKAVVSGPKGTLQVETTPSGAALLIDGVAMGGSPLLIKDVPAGVHFWRAALPNGEVLGGAAEVAAGKTTKVTAASTTKDPESRLLSVLSQNKLDQELLSAAKELAQGAQVDWLVFGALTKEGKGLGLDAFLFTAQPSEVRRLPHAQFDAELLSAGMELYNLAGGVLSKGAQAGEAVKVPAAVSSSLHSSGGVKLAEVKYGAQSKESLEPGAEPTAEPGKEDGPRKPAGSDKRKPLKK